jgi:hypothetical protein
VDIVLVIVVRGRPPQTTLKTGELSNPREPVQEPPLLAGKSFPDFSPEIRGRISRAPGIIGAAPGRERRAGPRR